MDPFPDSIHYINPAFSILKGKGYVVEREGRTITPDVPPLYTLSVLPFIALFHDARSFYFANVFLMIFSFVLFYRIVKKAFPSKIIQFLVLFVFASCLPISWYATLPMAENLILPLFLLALNLMIDEYSWRKSFLMAIVAVSFYATKFASIPLLVAFFILYLFKIFTEAKQKNTLVKRVTIFVAAVGVLAFIFEVFEYVLKGTGIITQIVPLFISVFIARSPSNTAIASTPKTVFFSLVFVKNNLQQYLGWLIGQKLIILWNQTQILSPVWAILSFIGLFIGLTKKKWQMLSVSLMLSTVSVIAFMMSFYTTDGRYFYTAFPTLFLGFGFALSWLSEFLKKHFLTFKNPILLAIFLIFFIQNIVPLKSAIMLNLRHAETPWTYISVIRVNDFLRRQKMANPKQPMPVVISPLSPYYIDFFTTEKMILLPLSSNQEARADQRKVWGEYDYKNLHQVYTNFLKQNVPVYFASYGVGNDKDMKQTRDNLKTDFEVIEVDTGCENVCNIYQLKLK